ncbi:ATP-binding protein [Actinoplanes sp. NPDC048796]|uniref:ATP-binding protein n=1 Tax=Actinoplanes sp. NPDC048796 TaxID=3155640 RepID=UPI003409239B
MTVTQGGEQKPPIEPPYLLTPAAEGRRPGVAVACDAGMTMVEMAVHGRWTPDLADQVAAALRMCLAGPVTTIIVGLHDLTDPDGASLSFWLSWWRAARFEPVPVPVLFSIAEATALGRRLRFRQGPQPRVHATVPEARAAAARRARADSRQVWLTPRPSSVKDARSLVTRACHDWNRSKLLPDMSLIASELAANAVEHARTDFVVTTWCHDARLYVVVHDCVSEFPVANDLTVAGRSAPLAERGRGLQLVHATAAAWGAVPAPDGKVVWAAVT